MFKHKIIVANPTIADPMFAGKAILLFANNKKGSHGVILNPREIGKVAFGAVDAGEIHGFMDDHNPISEIRDMIQEGQLQTVPLYQGGPMQTEGLFFLHGHEEFLGNDYDDEPEYDLGIPKNFSTGAPAFEGDESFRDDYYDEKTKADMTIMDGLYFGHPHTFARIIDSGQFEENKFRFYSGVSSWGPGQLEHEFNCGAWTLLNSPMPESELVFDIELLSKTIEQITGNKITHFESFDSDRPSWMPDIPSGYNPQWN